MLLLDEDLPGIESVDDIKAWAKAFKKWYQDYDQAISPVSEATLLEFTLRLVNNLENYSDNPPSPTIANDSQEVYNQFRILRLTILTVNQGMFTYTLPEIYVQKLIQTGAR